MFIRSFAPPSLCRTLSDTVDVCFHPTGQVFWLSRVSPCRTVEYISMLLSIYIYVLSHFQKNPNRGLRPRRRKGPGRRRHPEVRNTRAYTDANACFLRVREIPASSTASVVVSVTPLLAQLSGRQKRHVPETLLTLVFSPSF